MKTSGIKFWLRAVCAGAVAWALSGAAAADTWPSRPLRIVVPFPTGATPDLIARAVGERLSRSLKQPVVIDNKPGGSGIIGIEAVRNAPADGYTLLLADSGHLAINPALLKNLPYDPLRDFMPISRVIEQSFSVIVRSDFPADNIAQFVAVSKQRPNGLVYGTSGIGSVHHIGSERLRLLTGAKLMHVPYKGTSQSVPALLSGETDMMISSLTPVYSLWKSGKVKVLGRGSATRSALMPDVPTLKEQGVPLEISITVGFLVVAGTDPAIADRLNREINAAVADPELKARFADQDFSAEGSTREAYAKLIREQLAEYRKVIEETHIQAQ